MGERGRLALLVVVITVMLAAAVTRGPAITIRREALDQALEAYRIEVAELCAAGALSRSACVEYQHVWRELGIHGRAVPVATLEALAAEAEGVPGGERLYAVLEALIDYWPRPPAPPPGDHP